MRCYFSQDEDDLSPDNLVNNINGTRIKVGKLTNKINTLDCKIVFLQNKMDQMINLMNEILFRTNHINFLEKGIS